MMPDENPVPSTGRALLSGYVGLTRRADDHSLANKLMDQVDTLGVELGGGDPTHAMPATVQIGGTLG